VSPVKTYLKLDFEILPGEKRFTDAIEHEVRDGAAMFAKVADEYKGLTKPSGTTPGECGIAVADDLSRGSIWLPVPADMYVCFTWKGEVRSVSVVKTPGLRTQHYTADIHAGFPGILADAEVGVYKLPDWFATAHINRKWTLGTYDLLTDAVDALRKAV
jgi:hypothetical protein